MEPAALGAAVAMGARGDGERAASGSEAAGSPEDRAAATAQPAPAAARAPAAPAEQVGDEPAEPLALSGAVAESRRAEPGPRVPGRVLVLAAIGLLLAVLIGAGLALARNPGTRSNGQASSATTVASATTTTVASATTTGPTEAPATTAPATGQVPAGWVAYRNRAAGYVVMHPPGWTVRPGRGRVVDLVKPGSSEYLRIDWTPTPGPSALGAWRDFEPSFARRQQSYKRLRMQKTDFRGFDAAIWEYTYKVGGTRLHAVNLGFVASSSRAFALNFQTKDGDWAAQQGVFEALKQSFKIGA